MGNSLRDELLKAGLVSEAKLEKTRKQKRAGAKKSTKKPAKKRSEPSKQTPAESSNSTARHVLRENQRRTARFIRDSTLGGGSLADSARKALQRKIDALIERERLNDAEGDVPYHFVKGKRIKRIYVTEAQRLQLSSGEIVIAALEGNHHLLSKAAAEALLALTPQTVVCGGLEASGDGEEHPVPDDITW
jgi:uncharacterized protein YaiL (DUF2058 family)